MKFTQPCFVRVEDAEERKELIEWCQEIGRSGIFIKEAQIRNYIWAGSENSYQLRDDIPSNNPYMINCGTNIDLFKALAAMNDENDREQWFLTKSCGSFNTLHLGINGYKGGYPPVEVSKATATEIIEHFKTKQK